MEDTPFRFISLQHFLSAFCRVDAMRPEALRVASFTDVPHGPDVFVEDMYVPLVSNTLF